MDIAKNGNKGSGPVLMDRTQALTQLWTHAVARNGARKDEVVTAGALDAAATVCSPKFAADPPAQGAAAGLLAVLAKDPELCPRMIELKVDTFALDLCHCDSTAANDAAVSLLARLAENPNTRPAVVKTTTQRIAGWGVRGPHPAHPRMHRRCENRRGAILKPRVRARQGRTAAGGRIPRGR